MSSVGFLVLVLAGGAGEALGPQAPKISPYEAGAVSPGSNPALEERSSGASLLLGFKLIATLGVNVGGNIDNFQSVDVDQTNEFAAAVAFWIPVGESLSIEARLAFIAETELTASGIGQVENADALEGTFSLVWTIPSPGLIKPYLLAGWGEKRWDGKVSLDGELDLVAVGGGGLIIGLGGLELVVDLRAVLVAMNNADAAVNWQGSVGLAFGI